MIDPPRALIVSPREASPRKVRALRNVDIRARGKSEHWLQELVFRHPELLPISEISGEFSPAVPLGMEVEQIDALFVSPRGYLTIVETKLVDNPEARRAVMAQVIDYARKLSTWSTEDLAARVFAARPSVENDPGYPAPIGSSTTQLFQYVRDHAVSVMAGSSEDGPAVPPLIEEAEFLTALQRNMEHARFLLLVVGERDLARLQELVDALQHSFAFLQFTFAIVELTVYEVSDIAEEWLVVPRILLRTKEIRRSVARLEFEGSAKVSFTTPSGTAALRKRPTSEGHLLFRTMTSSTS